MLRDDCSLCRRFEGKEPDPGGALIETEFAIENITALDQMFEKMSKIESMAAWSRELEPHVVSGSTRWEIFRVL